MGRNRVLISTLILTPGGTATMTGKIVEYVRERGYEVSIAHYMPYKWAPSLSVPIWRILDKSPKSRVSTAFENVRCHEVGVRLPEIEWARYLPSRIWNELIEEHDYHIVVSGSALPALPILFQRKPCLAWVATPYLPDKLDRINAYPWYRKILDLMLDTPICLILEKRALREANVLALSHYTTNALRRISPGIRVERMPMPIDLEQFFPVARGSVTGCGQIGFSGRFDDPRKNIALLFEAFSICRRSGLDLKLQLVGAEPNAEVMGRVQALGLTEHVKFLGRRERRTLREFYQGLDAFVIPSHQEGLGIVGLEAMACGCPVVSTRCGGTEDYVEDGVNGFLVNFDARHMADAISRIATNPTLRKAMGERGLQKINNEYGDSSVRRIFWSAFEKTFN
jgi:glycosyltransferase involved in cell wall biosynthesis